VPTKTEKLAEKKARARRLRAAREHMGHATAKDAARMWKFPVNTYPQHENGTRGFVPHAKEYARAYQVPEEWLLYGKNPPPWAVPDMDYMEEERRGGADHFLRPWRIYREVPEDELADRLAVPVDVLRSWEAGALELSTKWLAKIASALETTPGAILDVDPAVIPPDLLDLWLDHAKRQRQVADRITLLKTGTAG
jgi:hypothetical protein